ncbi:hypothetical protein BH09SUM1_BH09SUM1_21530 [soil metagenome]
MSNDASSIAAQRRLLMSLGFGFLEEPWVPAEPVAEAPTPRAQVREAAPVRRVAAPQAAPSAKALGALSETPAMGAEERRRALEELAAGVRGCKLCDLHYSRRTAVSGAGHESARLMMIGEFPLPEDDQEGRPFLGEIGEMLTKMVAAMKLKSEDVYLTHAVKCRATGGRPVQAGEISSCAPHLAREIDIIRPQAIVCFGSAALESLLPHTGGEGHSMNRGRWLNYRGIAVMPTYALTYIHRKNERKRVVWEDMQKVMEMLGGA